MAKIKPLEWDDVQSETAVGTYDFGYVGGSWSLRLNGRDVEHGIAANYRVARGDAKQAAQHHFEGLLAPHLQPTT